jgi:arylformamidase
MKIIDLSQTLEHGMSVYPNDPPVHIRAIHSLEKEGWVLRQLRLGSHTGTHVDAPSHMHEDGATLDHLPLERFFGDAQKVHSTAESFPANIGLVFEEGSVDESMMERIVAASPRFVITGDKAELDLETERALLKRGILTFTDLINLFELPFDTTFTFFGIPLKIKNGDGSPIRAFAMLKD